MSVWSSLAKVFGAGVVALGVGGFLSQPLASAAELPPGKKSPPALTRAPRPPKPPKPQKPQKPQKPHKPHKPHASR